MAFWIFQADERKYRLLDAMRALQVESWTVRRYAQEIHAGDRVAIWKTQPRGGVYALAEIETDPTEMPEHPDSVSFWVDPADAAEVTLRVRLRYLAKFPDTPILRDDIGSDRILSEMLIMNQAAGTNFPVTPRQWRRLLELASMTAAPPALDPMSGAPPPTVKTTVTRYVRDTILTNAAKAEEDWTCQVCGLRITLSDGRGYAEGAHIRPLGGGHDGADVRDNILVLCPNHHTEFDLGIFFIDPETLVIQHLDPSNGIKGRRLTVRGTTPMRDNLEYHRTGIFQGN